MVFHDGPINKPHGLNVALPHATNDVVTIFDAEDDIHPDIFNVVNTVMEDRAVQVVQCGVQLMNYDSNWYSALNVLEYFFWFKSRLHYHARMRRRSRWAATPSSSTASCIGERRRLGRAQPDRGRRHRAAAVWHRRADPRRLRRPLRDAEETPPSLGQFIKQRTRWSQGFMQTLRKGTWKGLPTRKQRLLAVYTLAFPDVQALLGVYCPVLAGDDARLSRHRCWSAIISYLPVFMLARALPGLRRRPA